MSDHIKVYLMLYRGIYKLQWKDAATGKRKTESTGLKKRQKTEAYDLLVKKEKELNSEVIAADGSIQWSDFRLKYESQVLTGTSRRTTETFMSIMNTVEKFRKPSQLRQVNSRFLSEYVGWLRAKHRTESTLQAHLRHLKAVLRWAASNDYIPEPPAIPVIARASKRKMMKGRPITDAEFEVFLSKIPEVVGADHAANWERMACGLWLSGLRLEESTMLSWEPQDGLHIIVDGDKTKMRIPDWSEKGHQDRLYPLTPDFIEFLLAIPESERVGFVFQPTFTDHRSGKVSRYRNSREVGRTFSAIGEKAEIVVDTKRVPGKDPVVKHASAHDLRRSFGTRWSRLVQPAVLMQLMRHAAIQTTMAYYVGDDADQLQDVVRNAWKKSHNAGDNTKPDENKETPEK